MGDVSIDMVVLHINLGYLVTLHRVPSAASPTRLRAGNPHGHHHGVAAQVEIESKR